MSKEADALLREFLDFGIDAAGVHCRQPPPPEEPYPDEPKPEPTPEDGDDDDDC
jgi:hypothetical protein